MCIKYVCMNAKRACFIKYKIQIRIKKKCTTINC